MTDLPTSRIVEFGTPGAPTADERRRMDLGVRLFGIGLGLPAVVFLAYSGIANAGLAWALAPNAADAAGYILLALFISVAVGVLPLATGLLSESPKLKPLATMAWIAFVICFALTLAAAIGHVEFTRQTTGHPTARSAPTMPNTDIRRMAAIEASIRMFHEKQHKIRIENNTLAVMSGETLIKYTKGCTDFAYSDEREHCKDLAYYLREKDARERLDGYKAPTQSWGLRDFVPEKAVSWLQIGATGYFHLLAAFLGPLMLAVAAGAIDFMMTPPAPTAAPVMPTFAEPPTNGIAALRDYFEEFCVDCVELDDNAKGLKPPEIWEAFAKWSNENDYNPVPLSKSVFQDKWKARFGANAHHSGTQGGTIYDGIVLRG